jgi:hypothetical protein
MVEIVLKRRAGGLARLAAGRAAMSRPGPVLACSA